MALFLRFVSFALLNSQQRKHKQHHSRRAVNNINILQQQIRNRKWKYIKFHRLKVGLEQLEVGQNDFGELEVEASDYEPRNRLPTKL